MDSTPLSTYQAASSNAPSQTPSNTSPANAAEPNGGGRHWGGGGAAGGRGGGGQQILSQLDLTSDQKQQIAEIRSTITDRKARHDAMMNVLTPDQQAKYEELRAQMRAQWGGGGGGMHGGQ